jgi:hypothetical protein
MRDQDYLQDIKAAGLAALDFSGGASLDADS